MPTFKITLSDPKNKRSRSYEVKDSNAQPLLGLRIYDTFDTSILGIQGKAKITGGSDKAGIPMRDDVHGAVKRYVLLTKGTGVRAVKEGERIRKLVRGNTISDDIYQINAVLIEGIIEENSKG